MTKTEARKLAKACRAAVDLHTVGHAMAGVLFALPAWQRADTVLAFASMPDEPDTADILRQALLHLLLVKDKRAIYIFHLLVLFCFSHDIKPFPMGDKTYWYFYTTT